MSALRRSGRSSWNQRLRGQCSNPFQLSLIYYHMLMFKLQRHTISIKTQESRKLKLKEKDFRNSDIQDLP
ncbi:hypothetical protein Tco_0648126 [Tanacetum coccineum]